MTLRYSLMNLLIPGLICLLPSRTPASRTRVSRQSFIITTTVAGDYYPPIEEYEELRDRKVSDDGKRVAYLARSGQKRRVVVDGIPGRPFDAIDDLIGCFWFSDDSKRFAYPAVDGRQESMVVDGRPGKRYESVSNGLTSPFSPDGTRVAYEAMRGGKRYIVLDNQEYGPFEPFRIELGDRAGNLICEPQFSPDSKHVAYSAGRDRKEFVVVDRVEGVQYEEVDCRPQFSKNSRHIVYRAQTQEKKRVVMDGQEGPLYDQISSITMSDDGLHCAYVAGRGGKELVVIDGREGPLYDKVEVGPDFSLSGDGRRFAYTAVRAGRQYVVIDDKARGPYDLIRERSHADEDSVVLYRPERSADGRRSAYRAQTDGRQFVVVDGQPGRAFHRVRTVSDFFGPTGRQVAYVGEEGGRYFVVVDDRVCGPYDQVIDPVHGPHDKHVAFLAVRRGKHLAVVDGRESGLYDEVKHLTFCPRGDCVYYWARIGRKQFTVMNGTKGRDYDEVDADPVTVTSVGSQCGLAYRARKRGKWYLVRNGKEYGPFESVQNYLTTTADGRRLACQVQRQNKQFALVDGKPGKWYDEVHPPQFGPDGRHVAYWARRGARHYLVVDRSEVSVQDTFPLSVLSDGVTFDHPERLHSFLVRRGKIVRLVVTLH